MKAAANALMLLQSPSSTGSQQMTLPPALGAPDIKGPGQLPTAQGQHAGCSTCRQMMTPPALQHAGGTC